MKFDSSLIFLFQQNNGKFFKLPIIDHISVHFIHFLKNKFNYIFFLSFFIIKLGASQDYAYKNYSTKDGLAGNHVYHAVQDKEGYLWFATETGVSQFDGQHFVNFTCEQGLPSNEILKLFVDSKGRVWMMPFVNQICYYFKGKIYNSNNDSLIKKIKIKAFILDIKEDRLGNLFFIEQLNGLFAIDNKGDVIKYNNEICCAAIGLNKNGDLNLFAVLGNNDSSSRNAKIYSIDIYNHSFRINKINSNVQFKIDKVSQCLIGKNIFVYSNRKKNTAPSGDLCFNSSEFGIKVVKIEQGINSINQINDSICFINTSNGLIEYDVKSNIFKEKIILDENVVFSFVDNEYTNWIITSSNGVYKKAATNVTNYQLPLTIRKNENIVSLVFKDDKKYCISAKGALFEIAKSNQLKLIKKITIDTTQYIKKMIVNDEHLCIFHEHDLSFWDISKMKNPVRFKYYPSFSLKDFVFDKKRGCFFSSHLGVFNSGLTQYNSKMFFYKERSTCLALIDSGIFIGTLSGLKFVNWEKQVFDYSQSLKFITGTINCLKIEKSILWIGTNQNELIGYDYVKKEVIFSKKKLTQGNSIRCIYVDSNFIWVGTNSGLSKLIIDSYQIKTSRTYTLKDGLASDAINDIIRVGNEIIVATDRGCSSINLNENVVVSNCYLPFPKIKIANNIYFVSNENIQLKHNQSISFEYNAIALKSEGDVIYHHRILNLDSTWKSTQANLIDLEYLPSGDYIFELFCTDRFGINSNLIKIPIIVDKIWYKRTSFLFFAFFALVVILYLYLKSSRKKKERELENKLQNAQKIMQLEQEALKAQMNPHFIFNCLNAIQHYVIEKDVLSANKFISSFAGLIRQALDNSGKKSISIEEETRFLKSYIEIEANRFEDKFNYQIIVEEDIDSSLLQIPPMLIQPFVENAINHGLLHKKNGIGKLEIVFSSSEQMLKITITDNGIGRGASKSLSNDVGLIHVSKGISLTEMRIGRLNFSETNKIKLSIYDQYDAGGNADGTQVEILIPLIFNN